MVAFDIASTIAEFLADASRTSIELPHLTTGQRKHVKALVQQHHEIWCESYGFGSDRRLNLFKGEGKPEAQQQELQTSFPAQLPVRNTFIHIEDAPIDERIVQSMPGGMFRQSVLAESSSKFDASRKEACEPEVREPPMLASEPEAEPCACPVDTKMPSGQNTPFGIGALVVVEGLTKLPAFNGLSAVVQGWEEASGRYSILLVSAAGGCQQAKVKEENLRLLLPCP